MERGPAWTGTPDRSGRTVTELDWQDTVDGGLFAHVGAATYLICRSPRLPGVFKWSVFATHVEAEQTLTYLGWGHDVDDAKELVQLVVDSPIGDDSARMEWMRRHNRELADEVAP